MKKVLILVLVGAVLLPSLVWADGEFSPFIWKNQADPRLYPEIANMYNPAIIMGIDRITLFPNLVIDLSGSKDEDQHPDGHPLDGGTDSLKDHTIAPTIGLEGYVPIGRDMVAGGMLQFDGSWFSSEQTLDEFNFANEDITIKDANKFSQFELGGGIARDFGVLDGGVGVFFGRFSDPAEEEYNQIDGNPATSETYTTEVTAQANEKSTVLGGMVGVRYPINGNPFGAALGVLYQKDDDSDLLIPVDKNGDGFEESIEDYADVATSMAPWGLGFAEWDYSDVESTTMIQLNFDYNHELSAKWSLIGTGWWAMFGREKTEFYARTTSSDQSEDTTETNFGLGSFGLLGGAEFRPVDCVTLRGGLGFDRVHFKFTQDSLDAAGNSNFDPNNSDNLDEAALGANPDNDDIIGAASSPTTSTMYTFSILCGAVLDPAPNVQFFSDGGFSFYDMKDLYEVYNTSDGSVWEEEDKSSNLFWDFDILVGVAVKVKERVTLAITTEGIYGNGSRSKQFDELPADTAATGFGVDLNQSSTWTLNFGVTGAIDF